MKEQLALRNKCIVANELTLTALRRALTRERIASIIESEWYKLDHTNDCWNVVADAILALPEIKAVLTEQTP